MSNYKAQVEGMAEFYAGKEGIPEAPEESDEQFILRMDRLGYGWKPTMGLTIDARDLRRLVAICREREVQKITACSIIFKQAKAEHAFNAALVNVIRRFDQSPEGQGPAAVLCNVMKENKRE